MNTKLSKIIKSTNWPSSCWPFIEAQRLLEHLKQHPPLKGYVLFETGYGPSGLPHIGTFAEVARTAMVRAAFAQISDIPTKLYCFSDDMDGLRKVPTDLPQQEMLQKNLGKPLTAIPDPFYETQSYGHYMNAKLRSFLDSFGFEYEFLSATECYKSGMFDQMLLKVLDKYEEIMAVMLPTFREERQATYSPFMPICQDTGVVLQVPVTAIDKIAGTISYNDSRDGKLITVPVTKGCCKLQWKPDFAMRWAAFNIDYEMYGKDHRPNAMLYSKICQILDGTPPVQFFYELFLNEEGSKISKSKGNGLTIDEWLKYAPLESLALYLYHSPNKAKRLHFDVIPKNVDEYITFNQKYHAEEDLNKKLVNPLYHVHHGKVPKIDTYGVSFSLLLNLVGVCNPDNKGILWGFISKYAPGTSAEKAPYLDHLVGFALNYYNDFLKDNKQYLKPNEAQKNLLQKIKQMLEDIPEDIAAEAIQEKIYTIGMEAGYENLRDYFKELYQILLGKEEGPRLGSFIKLFGVSSTSILISEKL